MVVITQAEVKIPESLLITINTLYAGDVK